MQKFDIDKYVDAILPLEFAWREVREGVWKWQDMITEGKIKIAFQPDTRSSHQGEVTEQKKRWWCHTNRVAHVSPDGNLFLIVVSLISPDD